MTRWQFLRQHWVMTSIGVAILLTALVTIVWAVWTGEGDEGFLKENGKKLVWERSSLPVSCFYDESVEAHQHDLDVARDQIAEVGQLLGICDPWMLNKPFPQTPPRGSILLRVGKPPQGDGVYVVTPWSAKHGGTTLLYRDKGTGNLVGASIYVDPNVEKQFRSRVWLHEFMHAFGLKHDRLKGSLMYDAVQDRAQELSDRDKSRLRREYLQ
jgi:hypothetical protein